MGDEARSPRHRYSKCDEEYETVEEKNCEGLIHQFPNVLSSAFPGPCSAEQTSLGRNRKSAFEYTNFFMDDTKSQYFKPDSAAFFSHSRNRIFSSKKTILLACGLLFSLDRCLLMGDPIIHLFTSYST
jgi:hypothetical protein